VAGYYDMDGSYSDGCECQDDGYPSSCGAALNLGSIASGASASIVKTGNLTPSGDNDWFVVTFNTDESCDNHPKISVTSSGSIAKIQVYTSCSGGGPSCQEGGNATKDGDIWEYNNSTTCGYYDSIDPWPDTGTYIGGDLNSSGVLYIRVHAAGSVANCMSYTLTITNG
jgi:hypothetical protein